MVESSLTYVEPVEVQEEEDTQETVEKSIETGTSMISSVGCDDASRVQDLEWEPVESEQVPSERKCGESEVGDVLVERVVFLVSLLQVDVALGEFEQDVGDVMNKHDKNANLVVPLASRKELPDLNLISWDGN